MKNFRRALFERVIALRPRHALQISCAMLGVDAVQVPLPPGSPLYREAGGESVLLRLDDQVFPNVMANKMWQIEEVDFLVAHASGLPSVFIDVGANIGLVTRQLMHRAPFVAQAVCFEPHPRNFRVLSCNLAHLPGCHLVQAALGTTEGELRFYEDAHNVGNYSLNPDAMRGIEHRTSTIRCLEATAENLLSPLSEASRALPILWKSDTQGFDEAIVTALPDSFWSRVEAGVMELWRIERAAFDRVRLGSILGQFSVRRFSDHPNVNVGVDEILRYSEGSDYQFRDLYFSRK